MSAAVQYKR